MATQIDPATWTPPPAPEPTGPYAPDTRLLGIERWPTPGTGPEDVVLDVEGRVHAGLEDGRIVRWPAGGGLPEIVADVRGRPLGLEFDPEGRLVICNADLGLQRLDTESGRVENLVNAFRGALLRFTNNASITADGRIWFTDSSTRFGVHQYMDDLMEHRPNGRLLVHDPSTGETDLVVDELFFPNGVGKSADGSWLCVAETNTFRLNKVWITGDRAGQRETLLDNLIGFPDNLADSTNGRFWVAIANPRNPQLDALLPRPRLRKLVHRLPEVLKPKPSRFAMVIAVDESGQVVDKLSDVEGTSFTYTTGVREHDGYLYLGSLEDDAVGRVAL